jgi:putative ABC transport system permease protein
MFWQTILMSIREIRRNLMRSSLTILGIVIGVASVIIMVSIGTSATEKITSYLEDIGSNILSVQPSQVAWQGGVQGKSYFFTLADCSAIEREIDDVSLVAPISNRSLQAVFRNENRSTNIYGSDDNYIKIHSWSLSSGRSFTEAESTTGKAVCILGSTVRQELFGGENPIDATIRLKNVSLKVIGVFEEKANLSLGLGGDQNDFILIPIRTLQRRIAGNNDVQAIIVSGKEGVPGDKVKSELEYLLRERRRIREGKEDDFQVYVLEEFVKIVSTVTGVLTLVLSAIAAISLLVGGIGIMNIMLVSVTERTREIGIRLAVGALERNVLTQFLLEAIVLSSFGGLIGMGIGLGVTALACHFIQFPFVFKPGII